MKSSLLVAAALLLVGCSNAQLSSSSVQESMVPTTSATPEATPTTTPPEVLDTLPVTLTSATQRFSLPPGKYAVTWSIEAGDITDCSFAVVAYSANGDARLLDIALTGQNEASGETRVTLVDGTYSLKQVDYDELEGVYCKRPWSITIKNR
jgi:major membrane immunogen (membrane-anchored lipoprotein)